MLRHSYCLTHSLLPGFRCWYSFGVLHRRAIRKGFVMFCSRFPLWITCVRPAWPAGKDCSSSLLQVASFLLWTSGSVCYVYSLCFGTKQYMDGEAAQLLWMLSLCRSSRLDAWERSMFSPWEIACQFPGRGRNFSQITISLCAHALE